MMELFTKTGPKFIGAAFLLFVGGWSASIIINQVKGGTASISKEGWSLVGPNSIEELKKQIERKKELETAKN